MTRHLYSYISQNLCENICQILGLKKKHNTFNMENMAKEKGGNEESSYI